MQLQNQASPIPFLPLMLSIQNFSVSEPDSDGDMRAEAAFAYKNDTQEEQELIVSGLQVLGDGLVIASSTDEHEEQVDPGASVDLEVSSSYFKDVDSVSSHKLLLSVAGCRCVYKDLGEVEILQNAITGTAESFELGEGFLVQGLSVFAGLPDDDGDVTVEIKALVRNTSKLYSPKIRIEGSVKGQNGRQLDDCSTYGDTMMPNEARLLSASSYFKKSRLSGARVSVRICLFIGTSSERASA